MHSKRIALGASLLALACFQGWAACTVNESGVELEKDGKLIWRFVIDNPEQKPYIHPLTLPDGMCLTDIHPKDHVWHLGFWFCWKYLNGVNYWEPENTKRPGALPAGMTIVQDRKIELQGDAATVDLTLAYRERKAKDSAPLVIEKRKVSISAPDSKGHYTITLNHHFIAQRQVEINRTPPSMGEDWAWGGYTGNSLRLNPVLNTFKKRGSCGETSQIPIIKKERKWISYTDPKSGHGVKFELLKGTPQTRFYNWKDNRYINISPVYTGPIVLKAGETLVLSYQLSIY